MTADPITLSPDSLGSDILHIMLERRIGHLPVVDEGRLVGMVTQTDITRFQAASSALLVRDAAQPLEPIILELVHQRVFKTDMKRQKF